MVFQCVSLPCFILFHYHETDAVGNSLYKELPLSHDPNDGQAGPRQPSLRRLMRMHLPLGKRSAASNARKTISMYLVLRRVADSCVLSNKQFRQATIRLRFQIIVGLLIIARSLCTDAIIIIHAMTFVLYLI